MILKELLKGHWFVWLETLWHIVMSREEIKELISALFSALAAVLDIGVSGGIELELDLIHLESAVAVLVQLLEGLSHQVCSVVWQRSQDSVHELLKLDSAVSVLIEDAKYLLSLFLWAANFIIFKCFLELLEVKSARFIRVHDFELSLQPNQTLNTTLEYLLLKSSQVNLVLFLCCHCVEGLGVWDFILCVLNMITVLVVDIANKRIVFALLASDYFVVSLSLANVFIVCKTLSHWTALSFIVLGLGVTEREIWADHTWSDSGLTCGVHILALVSTALRLSCLWSSVAIILISPSFTVLLILSCISI